MFFVISWACTVVNKRAAKLSDFAFSVLQYSFLDGDRATTNAYVRAFEPNRVLRTVRSSDQLIAF